MRRGATNPDGEVASFTRHRYELPMLGVFLGLAILELFVVHFLLSLWSVTAAWVMSGLTLVALVQIGALIRGMIRNPTTVDRQAVLVRHGGKGAITIPLANIASVENVAFAPEVRGRDVFRASLLAQPNIALRLKSPLRVGRRERSMVTLRLDEAAAFLQLMGERLSGFRSGAAS